MSAVKDASRSACIPAGTWIVDRDRGEIGFVVKTGWGLTTVRGFFAAYQGALTVANSRISGELTIDARSLHTGNRRRDRHLRSPSFFDAERFPQIRFDLTAGVVDRTGFTAEGALQIVRVRLPLQIHGRLDEVADEAVSLHVATPISRSAAGITWDKLGMTCDTVGVHAELILARSRQ